MHPEDLKATGPQAPLFRAIQRINLCRYTIEETHLQLDPPTDPDAKADLLLAVEGLALEALDLLQTTKAYVWGYEAEPSDDEE